METSRDHRLGWMPGDGVGPELLRQAERVLQILSELDGFTYTLDRFPNSGAHYRQTGETLSDATVDRLRTCDALMLGAIGDPAAPPGLLEREVILGISQRLGLWLGIRGVFLHNESLTPIKNLRHGDIDMVIVRDVSEGELAIPGGAIQEGSEFESAFSTIAHSRHGVERTLRFAFDLAMQRRRSLTVVAQSNLLSAHRIWGQQMNVVGLEFPTVDYELMYPDHAAMQLVLEPGRFDVLVTTLLLGGIFSDLAGGLVGGVGLIGSVRLDPVSGYGLYEPAHGSAPKYAGSDRVSPMATLNALAMLLDDRGERQSAGRLRAAVDDVLRSGHAGLSARSGVGTTTATDLVIERLDAR